MLDMLNDLFPARIRRNIHSTYNNTDTSLISTNDTKWEKGFDKIRGVWQKWVKILKVLCT